ncbi:transcriptional regulator, IclR family [Cribrihabitans marinus]|uniref:Transcriptional regulator, IclR family n=1 Tax=Cribrihabitans marinus TaxID=1227549 RepID=A0A1H6TY28_9RHOB|nr:IclR family transcriptional regulator [Cribrihabitans marinus]GGH21162.1 IclR family transcriptional regulator [Cribrihabitans marinus]SEI84943.1 transcriptional regulator, IclR family [Cribrihabitans marinus]
MHLERLTSILEIVGQKGAVTVSEICTHADLPKPTAYRLVQDLVSVGLLEPLARGQFSVGSRLKQITHGGLSDSGLLDVIAPALARAATNHGAAFFLSRLRAGRVEIIHVATPDNGVSYLHPGVGKRPLHACSCSKVIAAYSPELLSRSALTGELRRYTDNTITSLRDLESEFEVIRAQGYAECIEELERGICSVATTLGVNGPGATLSIGVTASARVLTHARRKLIGETLRTMARDLSGTLGWREADADRKTG